ncbi:MAG: hypothetical protein M3X11_19090 [Acidobacteriota bacterium]|nr:hypothetical protein [Acidobacteriota bacterium]
MIKQTISILLAVQLMVSFGLCGGLCCMKAVELSEPQAITQSAESEENLPPCHRKKAAEKAASKLDNQTHSTHQTHSSNQNTVSKASASILNRDCCAMKREAPDGESLPSTVAPQTGKLVAVLVTSARCNGEIAFGLPPIPFQISATHSPPHTGFQLSLRI